MRQRVYLFAQTILFHPWSGGKTMTDVKSKPKLAMPKKPQLVNGNAAADTSIQTVNEEAVEDKKVLIACHPKWYEFASNLELKTNGSGRVDNDKLRRKVGSKLLKDCRPDLYEQIDRKEHPKEEENEKLHHGTTKLINWVCSLCKREWKSTVSYRNRWRHSSCPECSKKNIGDKLRLSQKEARKRFDECNFDLLDVYEGFYIPCKVKCRNCKGEMEKSLGNLPTGCVLCNVDRGVHHAKYTQKEAEDIYFSRGFKLLDIYEGNSKLHKVLCLTCKRETAERLTNLRSGCIECAIINGKYGMKYTQKQAENIFAFYNYKLLDVYNGNKGVYKVFCLTCKRETTKSFSHLHNRGCMSCAIINGACRGKLSQEEVEEGFLSFSFKLLESYIGSKAPHRVLCLICNRETTKIWTNLGKSGCRECAADRSESVGAQNIRKYLTENEISFYTELLLTLAPGKRYDFIIEDRKIIIEFDGEQHFKKCTWHEDEEDFLEHQEVDRRKTQAALLSGYTLIRIHKREYEDIKAFLDHVLTQVNNTPVLYVDDINMYEYILHIPLNDKSVQLLGTARENLPDLTKIVRTM